jgi:hypothetical protein
MFWATTHAAETIAHEMKNAVHGSRVVGAARIAGAQTRSVNRLIMPASALAATRGKIENGRLPSNSCIGRAPHDFLNLPALLQWGTSDTALAFVGTNLECRNSRSREPTECLARSSRPASSGKAICELFLSPGPGSRPDLPRIRRRRSVAVDTRRLPRSLLFPLGEMKGTILRR